MATKFRKYVLEGTYERPHITIKKKEEFSIHWVATSPLKAMEQARKAYYNAGYNNILFEAVYVEVSMMKALEKE